MHAPEVTPPGVGRSRLRPRRTRPWCRPASRRPAAAGRSTMPWWWPAGRRRRAGRALRGGMAHAHPGGGRRLPDGLGRGRHPGRQPGPSLGAAGAGRRGRGHQRLVDRRAVRLGGVGARPGVGGLRPPPTTVGRGGRPAGSVVALFHLPSSTAPALSVVGPLVAVIPVLVSAYRRQQGRTRRTLRLAVGATVVGARRHGRRLPRRRRRSAGRRRATGVSQARAGLAAARKGDTDSMNRDLAARRRRLRLGPRHLLGLVRAAVSVAPGASGTTPGRC